jgi:hypothetical protein
VSQLLSWRLVAALGALAGLALILNALLADDDSIAEVVDPEPTERYVDLVAPVFSVEHSDEFGVRPDGTTGGQADVYLDADRVVRIAPGTLGEIECDELQEIGRCALFADLLGEAVVWFALLPMEARSTAIVPEVLDLDEGYAVLANGWRIPYAQVIERECGGLDIPSFGDFLRDHGEGSTSVVDLETGEVVSVRCSDETIPTPTTTS